jgi:GH25 family lysozyme M1 (1,4-beta-N-acetylmuramidase)
MMLLGIDVSHYDDAVDWPLLARSGVAFAIVKASQGDYYRDDQCKKHLAGAQAAGLRRGIYHWVDPQCSPQRQVSFLLDAVRGLDFEFICLDVEQHAPWLAAYPAKPVPKKSKVKPGQKGAWIRKQAAPAVSFSSRQISDCAEKMARHLTERVDVPLVIYTRVSFIVEYARPMLQWLPGFPIWLAQYPLLPLPKGKLTWETLPEIHPRQAAPLLPSGCSTWTFWQWSGDRLRLPGVSSCLDLNFFNGSMDDLEAFLHPRPGLRAKAALPLEAGLA